MGRRHGEVMPAFCLARSHRRPQPQLRVQPEQGYRSGVGTGEGDLWPWGLVGTKAEGRPKRWLAAQGSLEGHLNKSGDSWDQETRGHLFLGR